MKITIRNVTAEDYKVLQELAAQCAPLKRHTSHTYWICCNYFPEWCFILEDDGTPVGYIMSVCTEDLVFVWQIGIVPALRGKGYSRLLLDAVTGRMKVMGYRRFQVILSLANGSAMGAFASMAREKGFLMHKVFTIHVSEDGKHETVFEFTRSI